jgi:uncharacterized protein YciI
MSSILFQRCGRLGLTRVGRAAPRGLIQLSTLIGHSNQVFVLEYTYVPNMIEKRVPVRPAHLEFTKPHIESKKLLAGGALLPGMEGGMLLFRAPKEYVEDFAKNDPYVVEQLVTEYRIREWAIAVGGV